MHEALHTLEHIVARLRNQTGRYTCQRFSPSQKHNTASKYLERVSSASSSFLSSSSSSSFSATNNVHHPKLPSLDSTDNDFPNMGEELDSIQTMLPAHEAEGLLGVCQFIIRNISPGVLLPKWPLFFVTFSEYLAHPASTVRQAASTVFKFVVAKDSNNPIILKLGKLHVTHIRKYTHMYIHDKPVFGLFFFFERVVRE